MVRSGIFFLGAAESWQMQQDPNASLFMQTGRGKEPFTEWLFGLRDMMGGKRILARVARRGQGKPKQGHKTSKRNFSKTPVKSIFGVVFLADS
jgi:hypothetical protein